jgi:type II secretory pathway pseudopilin PulG
MNPEMPALALHKARRRRISGITLVEVMLATAVIIVGCVGVVTALTRVQRNAIINRAQTNAYNILRNVMDQAMQLGWATPEDGATPLDPTKSTAQDTLSNGRPKPGPKDSLKPTIAGWDQAYIPNPSTAATVASDTNWKRWSMYNADNADLSNQTAALSSEVPVFQDYNTPANNIPARIYRKVQTVQNDRTLLWVTFRIEYTFRGQNYAHNLSSLRALD